MSAGRACEKVIGLVLACTLSSCGTDERLSNIPDTGGASGLGGAGATGGGAGSSGSGGITLDGGSDGGDDADDFTHALPVEVGDPIGSKGVFEPAGDHDFYVFSTDAGAWLRIWTRGNPSNDPELVNTSLRLYDGAHALVAANDDNPAPAELDAEIVTHIASAGDYFVEVFDQAGRGGPDFRYDVVVSEIDPGKGGVVIDAEPGDDVASAQPTAVDIPTAPYDYGEVLGTFDHPGDLDVYSFAIDEEGFVDELLLLEMGTQGNGSTSSWSTVFVTDDTASQVVSRIDGALGLRRLGLMGLDHGLIFVARPAQSAGSNDFYVAKLLSRPPDHAHELETQPGSNDTIATAESLEIGNDGARWYTRLLAAGDVDCFSFQAGLNALVRVRARSATLGSGVVGLVITLFDPAGATLASASETPMALADSGEVGLKMSGPHVVRVAKSGQNPDVTCDSVDLELSVSP